ncbi:MAG: hypothetical protein NTV34_04260 [Proteobacteria bacterium]|nr:hypothetical protein [Pseudomonadota bacterium]
MKMVRILIPVFLVPVLLVGFSCRHKTSKGGDSDLESSSSKTLFQCAVGKVQAEKGFRVNAIEGANGEIGLNLLLGSTVSGSKYQATKTAGSADEFPGTYVGTRNPNFSMELIVSKTKGENKYIRGFVASLDVVYQDVRNLSGQGVFKSDKEDDFVCGEKIGDFGS